MAHIATNAQLRANYRNNGEQADRIAINACITAGALPRAIENLNALAAHERSGLAYALRALADQIDTPILDEIAILNEVMSAEAGK